MSKIKRAAVALGLGLLITTALAIVGGAYMWLLSMAQEWFGVAGIASVTAFIIICVISGLAWQTLGKGQ